MAKFAIVKGISEKGQQKIKQWGDEWVILCERQFVMFNHKDGPWYFIQASTDMTETGESTCWVHGKDDPDFKLHKFGD